MKNAVIVALVCLNVGLLVGLIAGAVAPAEAQDGYFLKTNYVMVTGKIESGYDTVYVIDLATQRLGCWQFDRTRKRLNPIRGRDLTADFRGN